jgi:hypothetical protein
MDCAAVAFKICWLADSWPMDCATVAFKVCWFADKSSIDFEQLHATSSNEALPYTVQQGAIIHGNTFRRNLGSTLTGTLFSKIYLNEKIQLK